MATKRTQRRIKPLDKSQNDGAGATLSPAKAKVVIPAPEIIIPRIVPKTTTIPSSKI